MIGLKENSNRQSGVVYVRRRLQPAGPAAVDYVRWVMVRKRDPHRRRRGDVPELPAAFAPAARPACPTIALRLRFRARRLALPLGDYAPGERIDHVDGVTVEEAEHQIATRLFQNTTKVHFNLFSEGQGRFGRRLIYGGHVISLARALSFNGLANAFHVAGINGGRHVAPLFAGDTVFAWSEVVERAARPAAATSARCGFARWRPRTARAAISRRARAKATSPAWSSTSTIGRCCHARARGE